ncbi:MAG: hypothetical protein K2Z81_26445 [Cyanobacteria bacterium]|nr:hypothetical protein [Cyanobacteriota bacterium]
MNLKLRLERLCDGRSWTRLHFADGTTLTGRVLRIGHDYVEIESYGDSDKPYDSEYSKHLVPLNLVKFITIESSTFADAERRRLTYLSKMESNSDTLPELER